MDDPFSNGRPFELSPWADSCFTSNAECQDSLFTPLTLSSSLLELQETSAPFMNHDAFTIPELGKPGDSIDIIEEIREAQNSSPTPDVIPTGQLTETGEQPDIWQTDLEFAAHKIPQLCTWEAFEGKAVSDEQEIRLLSEAGPDAFDAAIALSRDGAHSQGVLPQDMSLRALGCLVLGRSSIFFRWDASDLKFVQVLPQIHTSGLSPQCSGDSITNFIEYGSLVCKLNDYAGTSASKRSCAAENAFKRSVTSILYALEARLSARVFHCCSLLQLQEAIDIPRRIVQTLNGLAQSVRGSKSDEEAISILSDRIHAIVYSESLIADVLRLVLARACAPWVARLANDLGLVANPDYQFLPDQADDTSTTSVSGEKISSRTFVDAEDLKQIAETRASLKILRKHMPTASTAAPISLIAKIATMKPSNRLLPGKEIWHRSHDVNTEGEKTHPSPDPWASAFRHEEYLDDLQKQMVGQPETVDVFSDAELYEMTITATKFDGDMLHRGYANPDYDDHFNPLDELRPLIRSQSLHLNQKLLRYVFLSCRLRQHLNLQRDFSLFGNSDFITRLSTALFSSDVQTARRTSGVVPTSQVMGLRLSAKDDQRWPPASSELRLALADVLVDAHRNQRGRGQENFKLPGGFGFTIRELPDEEIERTMDPGSIYALDFLKLEYVAPPPLDAILTPACLQRYDEVFRFMLKMIRLQYTVVRLQSVSTALSEKKGLAASFMAETQHVISTLMIYFMDISISAPWKAFTSCLDTVESSIMTEDDEISQNRTNSVGINYLRETHEACLEEIRGRMFLRKRQQRLQIAVEQVLSTTLHAAAALSTNDMAQKIGESRKALSELLKLLQAAVDKLPKIRSTSHSTEEDTEPLKILLSRLDWNEFYGPMM